MHAYEIIHNCPASIGQSSEEAIEASHKCFIGALNHHSRMNSYEKMTLDMVHNRLVGTDPIITSYFKKTVVRNKKDPVPFPIEVIRLFKPFDPHIILSPSVDFDEFDEIVNHPSMQFDALTYEYDE